jgi:hypothetical protein
MSSVKDRASDKSLFIGVHHAQTVITWAVDEYGIEFTVPVIGRIPVVGGLDIALIEEYFFGWTRYVGVGLP